MYPNATSAVTDELSQSLSGAQERLAQASARVRSIADTLFGPLPEGKEANGLRPSRSGRIGSLNDQAETLHGVLSDLDNQLARLASL